jgi:hypothetical protein
MLVICQVRLSIPELCGAQAPHTFDSMLPVDALCTRTADKNASVNNVRISYAAYVTAASAAAVASSQAGAKSVDITLPEGAVWYEALGGASFPGKAGKPLTTAVHLDALPVFYRGGHIVPRR